MRSLELISVAGFEKYLTNIAKEYYYPIPSFDNTNIFEQSFIDEYPDARYMAISIHLDKQGNAKTKDIEKIALWFNTLCEEEKLNKGCYGELSILPLYMPSMTLRAKLFLLVSSKFTNQELDEILKEKGLHKSKQNKQE